MRSAACSRQRGRIGQRAGGGDGNRECPGRPEPAEDVLADPPAWKSPANANSPAGAARPRPARRSSAARRRSRARTARRTRSRPRSARSRPPAHRRRPACRTAGARPHERVARGPDRDRGVGERERSVSAEPTSRPVTPKWAPLATVLLVPVRGPSSASGAVISVPIARPSARRRDRRPPAEPERHRQPAEDDHREREVPAEEHRRQVRRTRVALRLGDVRDPRLLDPPRAVHDRRLSIRDRRHGARDYARLKIQSRLDSTCIPGTGPGMQGACKRYAGDRPRYASRMQGWARAPARSPQPDPRQRDRRDRPHGVRGLRVEVVAAEAGVAVSLIYYYFGSRNGPRAGDARPRQRARRDSAPAGGRARRGSLLAELDEAARATTRVWGEILAIGGLRARTARAGARGDGRLGRRWWRARSGRGGQVRERARGTAERLTALVDGLCAAGSPARSSATWW